MRILGTMLSGLCLLTWVAYLSWPVSADGSVMPRQATVVETAKPTPLPAPVADALPTSDKLDSAV
jgi:hypothetical protein